MASALAGLAFGFLMMLPGHVFGATGAGDVKLFAAAGTLLGSGRIVTAFLYRRHRRRNPRGGHRHSAGTAWTDDGTDSPTCSDGQDKLKTEIESPAEHNRFSYGPAIAIGCVIAMLIGDSL